MQLELFPDPVCCTGLVTSRSYKDWTQECQKWRHLFRSQDIILGSHWYGYCVVEEVASENTITVWKDIGIKRELSQFLPPHALWIIRCPQSDKKVWENITKHLDAVVRAEGIKGKANEIVGKICDKFSGIYISPSEFAEKK